MYKKLLTVSISLSALLITMTALAQSAEDTKRSKLTQTEKRLEGLIKAAAAQNLLEVRRNEPRTPTAPSPSKTVSAVNQPKISCGREDLFSFPQEAHAQRYEDILTLKTGMITGPDQVDRHKAQILAQAYLGLGFGEEAINIAQHLQATEKSVVVAMAHLMSGTMNDTGNGAHRKTLDVNAACFGTAQVWLKLAQPDYQIFTDIDFDYLSKLPEQLSTILGLQLAVKAVQNKDLKTAQLIYDNIQSEAETRASYEPTISPYMQNDAVTLLGALLALGNDDIYEQNRGTSLLKSIAERDGPYRAQALQALVNTGNLYPEYMHDLDSVTQTFSETPSGKQAQAQKINFLAEQHKFTNAVTVTKDSFVSDSSYYAQSVIIISRKMLSDLSGTDANLQLGALTTLISEAEFFTHLANVKPLKHAGVKACISLGLPELIQKILPVPLWANLDDASLTLLTLQDTTPENFRIPQHIFERPALKAVELRKAFDNKDPKQAVTIINAYPNSISLQSAFTQAAWNNGYWSLAQKSLRKNPDGQVDNNLKLASTLSVLSPVLINTHRPDGLGDQQALQSYLNGDLKIIRSYLLQNTETTPREKFGAMTGPKNG